LFGHQWAQATNPRSTALPRWRSSGSWKPLSRAAETHGR
jgi:hypothetical protein